jgi:hypothetical protein
MQTRRIFQYQDGTQYDLVRMVSGWEVAIRRPGQASNEIPAIPFPEPTIRLATLRLLKQLAERDPNYLTGLRVPSEAPDEAYSAFRDVVALLVFLEECPGLGPQIDWAIVEPDPPDFLIDISGKKIGIEMTEWLDPRQTEDYEAMRDFELKFREIASASAIKEDIPAAWGLDSIAVDLEVREGSGGRMRFPRTDKDRLQIVSALWTFLRDQASTQIEDSSDPYAATGRSSMTPFSRFFTNPQLPETLRVYLDFVNIRSPSLGETVDVRINRGGVWTPVWGRDALLRVLAQKMTRYSDLERIKREKGLDQLHLVVYYDMAMWANTPYRGFQLMAGTPLMTAEASVTGEARNYLAQTGKVPFEEVYLVLRSKKLVFRLWP